MPSLTAKLVLSVFLFLCPYSVSAQEIEDVLVQLEEKKDLACRLPYTDTQQLFNRFIDHDDLAEQSLALNFLGTVDDWRIGPSQQVHNNALARLAEIARTGNIQTKTLAAQALRRADGELVDILSADLGIDERIDRLQSLRRNNRNANPVYLGLVELSTAEFIQEVALSIVNKEPLPLSAANPAFEKVRKDIEEAISLYEAVQQRFLDLRESQDFGVRDFSVDMPYHIALLKFIIGDESWVTDLENIIQSNPTSRSYSSSSNSRHIFLRRFFSPPAYVDAGRTTERCSEPRTATLRLLRARGSKQDPFYANPEQLAHFTCNVLHDLSETASIQDLSAALSSFANRDYRIVVGHYRGEEVRFSFLTKAELLLVAETASEQIASIVVDEQYSNFSSRCMQTERQHLERLPVGDQSTGATSGYIFVGDQLGLAEAEVVLDQVRDARELENAYLLRPVID